MNRFQQIFEANIFSFSKTSSEIEKLARDKDVTDQRIIKWLLKAEQRFLQDAKNDQENERTGYIKKHQKASDEPEWAANAFDASLTTARKDFLLHVIDFFKTKDDMYLNKLEKKTYDDIYNKEIPEWDKQLAAGAGTQTGNKLKRDVDYKVIYTWKDGFKIVEYLTKAGCEFEGETVGHCAAGYAPGELLSLWDNKNMPHATFEIKGTKRDIYQIKGKQNRAPIAKYTPYIIDFIKKFNLTVKADGENIGMTRYENSYYFKDDPEYKNIYNTKILPKQQQAIADIMKRIVTLDERYSYVMGYRDLLK
jgi:hypothetical protein